MEAAVQERYEEFDSKRKTAEAQLADAQDLRELEELERDLQQQKKENEES